MVTTYHRLKGLEDGCSIELSTICVRLNLVTAVYLKDDERVPVWTDYYTKAKANIGEEDLKRIYDAYSKRGG